MNINEIDFMKVEKRPVPKTAPEGTAVWYRGSGIKVAVIPTDDDNVCMVRVMDAKGEDITSALSMYGTGILSSVKVARGEIRRILQHEQELRTRGEQAPEAAGEAAEDPAPDPAPKAPEPAERRTGARLTFRRRKRVIGLGRDDTLPERSWHTMEMFDRLQGRGRRWRLSTVAQRERKGLA